MQSEFHKLIVEYQLHVLGFIRAVRTKFGVEDIQRAVERGEMPAVGTLDDRYETRFRFHGTGCRLESDRGEVDFDFGPASRHDGFDGWRLWIFAQSRQKDYPQFQRLEVVESALGELVTDGIVIRPGWAPSSHLCYFKEDPGPQINRRR
jgi:hypothetical protein